MRNLILKALQHESHVSGEELARTLNVSRTAVWKQINRLRRQGYGIDSSPRRGYSFIKGTDLLLPEEIGNGLLTARFGRDIHYRTEVFSTQDVAEDLAREGAPEGTAVIAETQTGGRGRRGRKWTSPTGSGIYLSLILRPVLSPVQAHQIPLLAGVAAGRAIRRNTPSEVKLKWPNDIVLNRKKAGGILTELRCDTDNIDYLILGIGINVNTPRKLLPQPLAGDVTSIAEECGEMVSRVKLVQALLAEFETLYTHYLVHGFDSIREQWKSLNNTIGSHVKVNTGNEEIEGLAQDIDKQGYLLVKKEGKGTQRIISGDVFLT